MPLERQMGKSLGEIEKHHKERYKWAARLLYGRTVVDAACGCGYGSLILSTVAKHVIGLDRSAEAVTHARRHYCSEKINYRVHDIDKSGFDPRINLQISAVVSLETIEHLSAPIGESLRKIREVLTPDGLVVFSHPALEKPNSNFYHKWFDLDPELVLNVTKQVGFEVVDRWEQVPDHKRYTYHLVAARKAPCQESSSTLAVVGTQNRDSGSSI